MRNLFIILLLLTFSIGAKAQYSTYHEFGFSVGPSAMLGDWGRGNEIAEYAGYSGGSFQVHHALRFARAKSLIKTSVGLSHIYMKHYKEDWLGDGTTIPQQQLAEMEGRTTLFTLGSRYELNLRDFGLYYPRNHWTPYVAIGFDAVFFIPNIDTNYGNGNIEDDANLHPIYKPDGIINDPAFTGSLRGAIGMKFKLHRQLFFFAEMELSRYFTDNVDGLEPNVSVSVDYSNSIHMGMMYTIY